MPYKLSVQIFVDKISGFCINVYGVVRVKSQSIDRKKTWYVVVETTQSAAERLSTMGSRSFLNQIGIFMPLPFHIYEIVKTWALKIETR